jgi:Bacteriophage baseplate protein W
MENSNAGNIDFLGRGWSFPPNFNMSTQTVDMTEKNDDIRNSLHILLTTTAGERVMEPKYGCNMEELLFESLDTTTKTLIKDKIRTAILYFEPRIDVTRIELNTQSELAGELLIEIDYVVRATNSRFNFVFPFYKNEGTEIGFLTGNQPTLP